MNTSPWQPHNEFARKQLELSDDYEIIMMSLEVEYFDEDKFIVEYEPDLVMEEILEKIDNHLHSIKLPPNHVLVAMQTSKDPDNLVYGIINIQP